MRPRSPLTRAIQSLGIPIKEFVEQKLGSTYASFRYRVRKGSLGLDEYHKLMQLTGRTFEELFPSPYAPGPQRIPVNLRSIEATDQGVRTIKEFQIPQPTTTTLPPRLTPEHKKEESHLVAPPAPSIYDDGLPPIDD